MKLRQTTAKELNAPFLLPWLGLQAESLWPVISALPSYGRGRELPGPRYGSLIHGQYLEDFVITGACLSAEEPFLLIPQSSDFICVLFFRNSAQQRQYACKFRICYLELHTVKATKLSFFLSM